MEASQIDEILYRFRWPLVFLLVGIIMSASGIYIYMRDTSSKTSNFQVIGGSALSENGGEVAVEVSGAVKSPGVYKLASGSRIDDALQQAGGLSTNADNEWVSKVLNRAAFVTDGQKLYIPTKGEQSGALSARNSGGTQSGSQVLSSGMQSSVNINTASAKELEALWGIGPVTAQNIIEQRPYSTVEELLVRKILKTNVYERNKELLTVY